VPMALTGSLSTFPITDLLQWLGGAGKTGTLHVERGRTVRLIEMKNGRVIGCSSDDPPHRLGQFLLSRHKITEEQLRAALAEQQTSGRFLGQILVDSGAITAADLSDHLESKAEETIFSVFDWADATFRFEEGELSETNPFPVVLRVEDVLLRGLKRFDEMSRIRKVLHDPGIVLRYTEKPPGPEIFKNRMARSMYSAIDGERSIAEILLLVRGSDYIVYKFLFELHRNGYVEMAGIKKVAETVPDPAPAAAPAPAGGGRASARPKSRAAPAAPAPVVLAGLAHDASAEERLAAARRLLSENKFDCALDILDGLYRTAPEDDALRRMIAEAEVAFVDRAYRHSLPEHKIPVLTRPAADLAKEARLTPQEFFLLSRIDGLWDVRSIIQVSPLREVDALRTLKRLRELGMIELHDPVE
jgi:hypothetical protein